MHIIYQMEWYVFFFNLHNVVKLLFTDTLASDSMILKG